MNFKHRAFALSFGLFVATTSFAQGTAPKLGASVPSSSTAGVALPGLKSIPVAAPAAASSAATPAVKADASLGSKRAIDAVAAGGGNGKVWVNAKSKKYHCEGTPFYGKTKAGEYMTEADAKAKGNHGVTDKACAK